MSRARKTISPLWWSLFLCIFKFGTKDFLKKENRMKNGKVIALLNMWTRFLKGTTKLEYDFDGDKHTVFTFFWVHIMLISPNNVLTECICTQVSSHSMLKKKIQLIFRDPSYIYVLLLYSSILLRIGSHILLPSNERNLNVHSTRCIIIP